MFFNANNCQFSYVGRTIKNHSRIILIKINSRSKNYAGLKSAHQPYEYNERDEINLNPKKQREFEQVKPIRLFYVGDCKGNERSVEQHKNTQDLWYASLNPHKLLKFLSA